MLFKTVYGPELEAIYQFIQTHEPSRPTLYQMFVPQGDVSRQNVEDAIAFLLAAYLIDEHETKLTANPTPFTAFRLSLLWSLQRLNTHQQDPMNKIDPLYMHLLAKIFIEPNVMYCQDVHKAANSLEGVKALGGLSREKVLAWKRVMAFIGVGYRAFSGFACVVTPSLFCAILEAWDTSEDTLQAFLDEHLAQFLPYKQHDGDLADALSTPMLYLYQQGTIHLSGLQDSPNRAFFGNRRFKFIQFLAKTTQAAK